MKATVVGMWAIAVVRPAISWCPSTLSLSARQYTTQHPAGTSQQPAAWALLPTALGAANVHQHDTGRRLAAFRGDHETLT
ncbi:hypothetical protein O3P69_004669 [Scylla paramamosain]|uniref:Secreted protein n=1 Tax=Scylla paramamosain TaxID=85552 RepID=A0AAW0UC04_SCYPA